MLSDGVVGYDIVGQIDRDLSRVRCDALRPLTRSAPSTGTETTLPEVGRAQNKK